MKNNNCELIRRELDELMPGEATSAAAIEHLRECAACREFHEKQTKLRQIVGSLGTVAAPPDFDFRLRARLASESGSAVYHLSSAYALFARRGLAIAATLLVFATVAVLVRNVINRSPTVSDVAHQDQSAVPQSSTTAEPVAAPPSSVSSQPSFVADNSDSRPKQIKTERATTVSYKPRRQLATLDISNERAELISGAQPVGVSAAFPIDASLQSFKVSLDDGSGNAKTISVPTISFGSQRIVRDANQFAPKRDW
jgi:hypothetical protein